MWQTRMNKPKLTYRLCKVQEQLIEIFQRRTCSVMFAVCTNVKTKLKRKKKKMNDKSEIVSWDAATNYVNVLKERKRKKSLNWEMYDLRLVLFFLRLFFFPFSSILIVTAVIKLVTMKRRRRSTRNDEWRKES